MAFSGIQGSFQCSQLSECEQSVSSQHTEHSLEVMQTSNAFFLLCPDLGSTVDRTQSSVFPRVFCSFILDNISNIVPYLGSVTGCCFNKIGKEQLQQHLYLSFIKMCRIYIYPYLTCKLEVGACTKMAGCDLRSLRSKNLLCAEGFGEKAAQFKYLALYAGGL